MTFGENELNRLKRADLQLSSEFERPLPIEIAATAKI